MDKILRGIVTVPVMLILMATTLSGTAIAEPDKPMMHSERHDGLLGQDFVGHSLRGLLRHAKDLGLSEEQVTKIKEQAIAYAKARIRGEADLKLAEVDVQSLVHDAKSDMAAIEAAIKKAEASHAALRIEGVKAFRAASAVLTPEQREKWKTIRSARHSEERGEGGYGKEGTGDSKSEKK